MQYLTEMRMLLWVNEQVTETLLRSQRSTVAFAWFAAMAVTQPPTFRAKAQGSSATPRTVKSLFNSSMNSAK